MPTKKQHPYSRCTDCHVFGDDDVINKRCLSCKKGTMKSELRPNTLFECQVCEATGKTGNHSCGACNATGWLFTNVFWGGN